MQDLALDRLVEKKNQNQASKQVMRFIYCFQNRRNSICLIFSIILIIFSTDAWSQRREVITTENEFGGRTIEEVREDYSIFTSYFDADGNIAKEETIYTNDYPIDNNLSKLNVYYYFGKKVKEERIYNTSFAYRTLISKSIDHFDRNNGELVKRENHFIRPFTEYNIIYRDRGKKTVIEWHYPDNIEGIKKNVSYLNEKEQIVKTETFYTDKTTAEEGYFKRIYFSEYNTNEYYRKSRQEWFYTSQYAKENKGISKKVEFFHYSLGAPVRVETVYYDANNQLMQLD